MTNLNADAWSLIQEIDAAMAKAAQQYQNVRAERERRYRAFGLDPAVRWVRDAETGDVTEAASVAVPSQEAVG